MAANLGSNIVRGPGQNAAASSFYATPEFVWNPGDTFDIAYAGQMDNQRIPRGPLLSYEDAGHCLCGKRIGAQAIDRLRREGDQPAGSQQLCGALDVGLVGGP